jgi:photosystem II stability/assembly factor-like uncharacterized protein
VLGQQSAAATVIGQPAPAGTGDLGAVSCADSQHCWAVGIAGPNAASAPKGTPVTVISASRDGGVTWVPQPLSLPSPPELSDIACPTPSACMAVGSTGVAAAGAGVVLTTRNGGTTWTSATVPTGAFVLTSVECAALDSCSVLVSDGTNIWSAHTSDFGHTWTQGGNLPAGFSDPRDLTCLLDATCLVVGYTPTSTGHGQGAIALSTDAGATWAAGTVPGGSGLLEAAACTSASSCEAVGTTSTTVSDVVPAQGLVLESTDGGHTWAASPNTPPVDEIYGIACPSAPVCVIVGTHWHGDPVIGSGAVAHSTDGGTLYNSSVTAYTPLSLTALSCPTAIACVAVGGDVVARISLPAVSPSPGSTHRPSG